MTAVSQTALFYVAGDRLSKTQPAKIDFSNSPLWHRWLQPLWAVKQTLPAAFDHAKIASELAALDRGEAKSYRVKLLAVLRQHLAAATTKIEQDFYSSNDGAIYVGQHARCIDGLLTLLYDEAGKLMPQSHDIAVIAVGGYGRGEMAPFSDIDVMFLMPAKISKKHEAAIEFMLYMLWDLGLKIGHSTRSITEAITAGRDDQTVMTSFLEMRHVCGQAALWKKLSTAWRREIGKNKPLAFVEEKLAERDLRHKRFDDTRYVVEPNVKDGKGGLRDLHSLFWIAKYAYRADGIMDLLAQGVLRDAEARRFASAQRFLWTVRCHLHFHAGRAEERLDFEAQMAIAPRMGFSDRYGMRAVERFMKRYYLAIRHVGDLTRIFCAVMETDFRKQLTLWRPDFLRAKNLDPFFIESGRVRLHENLWFRDDPIRIFRLFAIAQTYNADVHPHSLQRVTRGLPSVGTKIRQDPQANALFVEILTASKNSERVLRL
ncbi:MAG: nucleotidyltransferase domain-containing protein, partial [Candidatus Puniceispirillaceae bacterium]